MVVVHLYEGPYDFYEMLFGVSYRVVWGATPDGRCEIASTMFGDVLEGEP